MLSFTFTCISVHLNGNGDVCVNRNCTVCVNTTPVERAAMSVALATISSHGNQERFTRETRVKVMTETRQLAL